MNREGEGVISSDKVLHEKGGDGRRSGKILWASFVQRGEKERGGSVGTEGWRRISQEEKGPVQKRSDEIRVPSAALRERERRIQEETILDCKQGVTETGEKSSRLILRGKGRRGTNSLSPPLHTPLMAGSVRFLPSGFKPRHDAGSGVQDGARGRFARTTGRGLEK